MRVSRRENWPGLAWRARLVPGSSEVDLEAGSGVDCGEDWFCEGVWDGDFSAAGFAETDVFFGSGACLEERDVVFVPSAATVDRIQYAVVDRPDAAPAFVVANSLPCLLAATGGALLEGVDHRAIFGSIGRGIHEYDAAIPTTAGPVTLVYHHHLRWDGHDLTLHPKPQPVRDFGTYETYRGFLASTMAAVAANAADPARCRPMSLLPTISSGYDSSAVAALAAEAGAEEAMGFDLGREGDDDGTPVAAALGLRFHSLASDAFTSVPGVETRFLSTGMAGGSSVPFLAAENLLADRVLLTGYHGDKMWDLETEDLGSHHPRVDLGGCDLQEFRLSAGFIQIPVPFWGSSQMVDVHGISTQEAMEPWSVGGDYDRPIARRILEDAGVPRGSFAVKKNAVQQFVVLTAETALAFALWSQQQGQTDLVGAERAEALLRWSVERETARYSD